MKHYRFLLQRTQLRAMQFDIWSCFFLDCCCQLCETSGGHRKIFPQTYGSESIVSKEASDFKLALFQLLVKIYFQLSLKNSWCAFLTLLFYYICLFFRTGTLRCATIEEIEAEKSLIEKNVVSI